MTDKTYESWSSLVKQDQGALDDPDGESPDMLDEEVDEASDGEDLVDAAVVPEDVAEDVAEVKPDPKGEGWDIDPSLRRPGTGINLPRKKNPWES